MVAHNIAISEHLWHIYMILSQAILNICTYDHPEPQPIPSGSNSANTNFVYTWRSPTSSTSDKILYTIYLCIWGWTHFLYSFQTNTALFSHSICMQMFWEIKKICYHVTVYLPESIWPVCNFLQHHNTNKSFKNWIRQKYQSYSKYIYAIWSIIPLHMISF